MFMIGSSRSSLAAAAFLAAAISTAAFPAAAQASPPAASPATPGGLSFATSGGWKASVFGDVGGADKINAENFEIAEKGEGQVSMRSSNDRGKIASGSEGLAFYYRELPAAEDFELSATATVASFGKNNQVSLGIMLRDKVFANASVNAGMGSYIAVGPINAATQAPLYSFRRTVDEGLVKAGEIKKSALPCPGAVYRLSLKKSGDDYTLRMGDEEPIVLPSFSGLRGDTLYLGFFTSRNASVSFGDIAFSRARSASSGPGADRPVPAAGDIAPPACTGLSPLFLPLKTDYRLGDTCDLAGLRVQAIYGPGRKAAEIGPELYSATIDGKEAAGYVFGKAGSYLVSLASKETPTTRASFELKVSPAKLQRITLGRPPAKAGYFVGEALDLAGMTVYAEYDDGARLRLAPEEYRVSALDASTPGRKTLKIEHKGASAPLELAVKARSVLGLALASRPRTSYLVGESFDPRGLELARAYDDGSADRLDPALWSLDLSAVDFGKPGLYEARADLLAGGLPPLALPIAVRPAAAPAWKAIRFGQSSSDAKDYAEEPAEGVVRLVALEGGGKVTGDHDGMVFYYTELDAAVDDFTLSADIKVLAFAKDPPDGQEAFGIMARDVLGKAGDAGIAASNMAAVGGYSGGTKSPIGTQLFARSGVSSPSGAGSLGVQALMLEPGKPDEAGSYPARPYRLSLSKTNSGFTARVNGGEPRTIWEPGLLSAQDGKMYLGFFAARLATIEVSGIRLELSSTAADEPRATPPHAKAKPELAILSSDRSPETGYSLVLRASVAGSLTVKLGAETLARELELKAGQTISLPATLAANGATPFVAALAPDDRQELESYSTLIQSIAVTQRSYVPGGDIQVSPAGRADGDGTAAAPLDLYTAIAFVRAGQRIVLAGGRYERYERLSIPRYVDGAKGKEKAIVAAPGTRPLLDFSRRSEGVVLSGDFWRVVGLDVARSGPNMKGFTIGGDDNVVEDCRFYGNGDTGCQISRTDALDAEPSSWPSRNLVLNCESFDNRDPAENNADGFAAKLTSGEGNAFRGCVSRNNIDDGWDLYTKAGTGPIGPVLIEGCVAYGNGRLSSGEAGRGDKNGFKLGGEGIAVRHVVRNCLAYGNGAAGFTCNSNPSLRLEGAFSLDNEGPNFSFATYAGAAADFAVASAYSYKSSGGTADALPSQEIGGFYFDGAFSRNAAGWILSREDFDEAMEKAGLALGAILGTGAKR
jgi:pectate disaccharide-lyase